MSDIITLDVRTTPQEFDACEHVIGLLQQIWPSMSIDDAVDFIFRAGLDYLQDQNIMALGAADAWPEPARAES